MKKNLAVIIVFILLVAVMTFPLLINIHKSIPGFFSTDESFGALWDSWRIKFSFTHKLSFNHVSVIAHPFGSNMYQPGFISYLWMSLLYFLSILTTPALTFNLQIFFNLFFNGILTYLLVYHLTKNKVSGIFSGIIFAFCPYQFVRIWQHLGLSYNEFIVFSLYAIILLRENYNRRHSVLFFFSLLLLFSFDFSIMFFGFIVLCVFIAYSVVYRLINRKLYPKTTDLSYIKKAVFTAMLTIPLLFFQFFSLIKKIFIFSSLNAPSAHNLYRRPFNDLFEQSARPLSYFLPSSSHPVFGKFTEQFVGTKLYGVSFTEHALYLGWIPLLFAFLTFQRWKKNRKFQAQELANSGVNDDFYISFFILLAIVAWFFSQPPWWELGPVKIYMPSFFMYKILPMYRAYCRFGIVVMLAVAVLAGYGLKFVLEGLKSKNAKSTMAILFCGLVLFEFWNYPPFKVIDISKVPSVYYWLKEQPKGIVIAEYPLDSGSPNEMYKFYQITHEKRIINGTIPGTYANKFAQDIIKLSDPKTEIILKSMGVTYVLIHHEGYLNTELTEDKEELKRIPTNPSLKFIKSYPEQDCPQQNLMCVAKAGPIDVYEVIVNCPADK